jgi:hypothetical protein
LAEIEDEMISLKAKTDLFTNFDPEIVNDYEERKKEVFLG